MKTLKTPMEKYIKNRIIIHVMWLVQISLLMGLCFKMNHTLIAWGFVYLMFYPLSNIFFTIADHYRTKENNNN